MIPPLKQYRPKDDAELLAWVLDVKRITKARERVEFRYLSGRAVGVRVTSIERPMRIDVSATNRVTNRTENPRMVWSWNRQSITVHEIDVSSSSDEYDVTIELVR